MPKHRTTKNRNADYFKKRRGTKSKSESARNTKAPVPSVHTNTNHFTSDPIRTVRVSEGRMQHMAKKSTGIIRVGSASSIYINEDPIDGPKMIITMMTEHQQPVTSAQAEVIREFNQYLASRLVDAYRARGPGVALALAQNNQ